jgi:hypothetical protein
MRPTHDLRLDPVQPKLTTTPAVPVFPAIAIGNTGTLAPGPRPQTPLVDAILKERGSRHPPANATASDSKRDGVRVCDLKPHTGEAQGHTPVTDPITRGRHSPVYHVGDSYPGGRVVAEVDEAGRVTVLHKARPAPDAADCPKCGSDSCAGGCS